MAVFINHFEYSDPVHLSQLMAFLSSNTNYIGPLSQLWSDVLLIIRKVEALYFYISKLLRLVLIIRGKVEACSFETRLDLYLYLYLCFLFFLFLNFVPRLDHQRKSGSLQF